MSKPRGRTRLLTQIMKGGDLLQVGDSTITFGFPDVPDYRYIFSREEHPCFLALTTPEGLVFKCKLCQAHHILFWNGSETWHASERIIALWEELRQSHRASNL